MIVGYMGDIPFVTSRRYLLTFYDFNRDSEARWAKHNIIGDKPVMEFLGPDTENISMNISLRRDHGINVENMLDRLRKMRDTGEAFTLVLGSKVIGSIVQRLLFKKKFGTNTGLWVLKGLKETTKHWAGGNQNIVDVTVTLEEYPGRLI
mgnify:CR=1 FL=1